MACPRNNARVLNLSIGGVARAQNSPSSSQLSNTGIHPSLKIPLLPPFLKDLWCSRNSLTCAGGAAPKIIQLCSSSPKTPAPRRGPGLKSHLGPTGTNLDKSRYKLDSPKKLMTRDNLQQYNLRERRNICDLGRTFTPPGVGKTLCASTKVREDDPGA